ncbi:MAG: hypothetical protein PHS38_11675 [Bacteroidales bacterium]|nr:hypothetical protein [Bacteroidales bacterium]
MENNQSNLLAAIAVFAELCNTKTDIKSIINEFIKSVYGFESVLALDSVEVMNLLKKHFDFDIPEAVVKTCLNSLKNEGFLMKNYGRYIINDKTYNSNYFLEILNLKKRDQIYIEHKLVEYYTSVYKGELKHVEKKDLIENFFSYLMDNGVSDEYSTIISSFVMENSKDQEFVTSLNQLKVGLIQITGLKYTSDLTNLGKWSDELTIYLDTEVLFNSAGYNGTVYKKLFDDFFSLINEINLTAKKNGLNKYIYLRFFEETKSEIDRFFSMAEKIVKREYNLTPCNSAMIEICKGCASVCDLIRKKTEFETDLKSKGILQQAELDYYIRPEYVVESSELIEKYKKVFVEDDVCQILQSFTKINYLRKGLNRTSFEKCKHIILTGKNASLRLSKDLEIKNDAKDIPFSTDIYFITNRLWFKLNKGLSKHEKPLSTLDIVVKAQVVLSSQISKSVRKRYDDLSADSKSGKLTTNIAREYYHNLRDQSKKPEEINNQNVHESIEIIFEEDLESYLREKSAMMSKIDEGEAAKKELRKLKIETYIQKKKQVKRKYKIIYWTMIIIIMLLIISYFTFFIWLIINSISNSDTKYAIICGLFTIAPPIVGLFSKKKIRIIHDYIKKKTIDKYTVELTKQVL